MALIFFLKRATNAVLEWLKSVKKSHGSVAVNSLDQAKAINATGRYEIGNNGICGRSKKLVSLHSIKCGSYYYVTDSL